MAPKGNKGNKKNEDSKEYLEKRKRNNDVRFKINLIKKFHKMMKLNLFFRLSKNREIKRSKKLMRQLRKCKIYEKATKNWREKLKNNERQKKCLKIYFQSKQHEEMR